MRSFFILSKNFVKSIIYTTFVKHTHTNLEL